jgi:predicted extracellular nuclease
VILSLLLCLLLITMANGQRLFFSQYVKGTSTGGDAGLEIFNPTCNSIALSEYQIDFAQDGGAWTGTTITLSSVATNIASQVILLNHFAWLYIN